MLLPLLALLAAGPPQGYAVALEPLERVDTTEVEAKLVESAMAEELAAQGYGVEKKRDARGVKAVMAGRLVKREGMYVVELTLTQASDGKVLDDDRRKVAKKEELPEAGRELVKSLAREMRMVFGVRARIKL